MSDSRIVLSIFAILGAVVLLLSGSCFGFFGVMFVGGTSGSDKGAAILWMIIGAALIFGGVKLFQFGLRYGRNSNEEQTPHA